MLLFKYGVFDFNLFQCTIAAFFCHWNGTGDPLIPGNDVSFGRLIDGCREGLFFTLHAPSVHAFHVFCTADTLLNDLMYIRTCNDAQLVKFPDLKTDVLVAFTRTCFSL